MFSRLSKVVTLCGQSLYMKKYFSYIYKIDVFILLGVLLIASIVRLYKILYIPIGLPEDEVIWIDSIRGIIEGRYKGLYGFYSWGYATGKWYLISPVFALNIFNDLFLLRFTNALFSIFTVAALWYICKTLWNQNIALVSVLLLSVHYWHIVQSRIGLYVTLVVLVLLVSLFLLLISIYKNNYKMAIVSGVLFASSVYFHKLGLAHYAILIPCLFFIAIVNSKIRLNKVFWCGFGIAVVVAMPMIYVYLDAIDIYSQLNNLYYTPIGDNTNYKIDMSKLIHIFGIGSIQIDGLDGLHGNWLPNYIFILPFVIGLVISIIKIKDIKYQYILIIFVSSIFPYIIVDGRATRAFLLGTVIGCVFVAIGVMFIFEILKKYFKNTRKISYCFLVMVVIIWSSICLNQFYKWENSDSTDWILSSKMVAALYDINQYIDNTSVFEDDPEIYLHYSRRDCNYFMIRYLSPDIICHDGDGDYSNNGIHVVISAEDISRSKIIHTIHPSTKIFVNSYDYDYIIYITNPN